jgi:DNA-binding CsgD family transcriptional regulator
MAIRRLLTEQQQGVLRASVLLAAVEILVDTDEEQAQRAAAELAEMSEQYAAPALRALAAQADGIVRLAQGDDLSALNRLREAWMLWQELEAPYEAARVRVLLGHVCQHLGDDRTAELEFDTARRIFERLAAAPDIARVDAMRQHDHDAGAGVLTARELQVIELVAKGKTNRAIALELSISERTVDRHVSNILVKLDLPSRSAATAYVYQHGLLANG